MPAGPFTTLYGAVAEGETYYAAAIELYVGTPTAGIAVFIGTYAPVGTDFDGAAQNDKIEELFPNPIIVPGQFARLTSRRIRWENRSQSVVHFDGIGLFLYRDKLHSQLVAAHPMPTDWQPGHVIAGRFLATANIFDD